MFKPFFKPLNGIDLLLYFCGGQLNTFGFLEGDWMKKATWISYLSFIFTHDDIFRSYLTTLTGMDAIVKPRGLVSTYTALNV